MSALFSPLTLRGLTLKNRLVISPMCQYMATDGLVSDWHLVQYGRFAVGGAGLVFVEATMVSEEGRATMGDLGIWSDAQVPGLKRIVDFVHAQGAAVALQLGHAGPKGSAQRPWHGMGPLSASDLAERGEAPWPMIGPTDEPAGPGFATPRAMTAEDIAQLRQAYIDAAGRALAAGFDVLELHAAHGYLLHRFLSPLTNHRSDEWGGDLAGRMRLVLEIARDLRGIWPVAKPLFVRISADDYSEGGWTGEDSVALARALKDCGVDVVDCSSGGIAGSATNGRLPRGPGFQVPYAEAVRRDADVASMAVGLILTPQQAEAVIAEGRADLVAIGREALVNPNWPLMALEKLSDGAADFSAWPAPHGWWLDKRAAILQSLGL